MNLPKKSTLIRLTIFLLEKYGSSILLYNGTYNKGSKGETGNFSRLDHYGQKQDPN